MNNKYVVQNPLITTMEDDLKGARAEYIADNGRQSRGSGDLYTVPGPVISPGGSIRPSGLIKALEAPLPKVIPKIVNKNVVGANIAPPASKPPMPPELRYGAASTPKPAPPPLFKKYLEIPDRLPRATEPTEPEEIIIASSKPGSKILWIIIAALILGAFGGFIYYKNLSLFSPRELKIIEHDKPKSLIDISRDEIIIIDRDEAVNESINKDLANLLQKDYTVGEFIRVLVKSITGDKSQNIEYRTFSNFVDFMEKNLEIKMPPSLLGSGALGDFTFFIYSQDKYSQNNGNRLGFVVDIIEDEVMDISVVDDTLNGWEEESLINDFSPLLKLTNFDVNSPDTEFFNDVTYSGIDIRYMNFDGSKSSIAYTIVDGYLVVATSRDSMYATIDNLFSQK